MKTFILLRFYLSYLYRIHTGICINTVTCLYLIQIVRKCIVCTRDGEFENKNEVTYHCPLICCINLVYFLSFLTSILKILHQEILKFCSFHVAPFRFQIYKNKAIFVSHKNCTLMYFTSKLNFKIADENHQFSIVYYCFIFSIGDNWSFDDDISRKYNCTVRSFDPR